MDDEAMQRLRVQYPDRREKVICDEKDQWTFITHVPRLDRRKEEHFTQGWVASKFTTHDARAARCTRALLGG